MKRLDVVQLTIIIIGLFSAFFFISLIPQFLYFIFSWFGEGLKGGYLLQAFIQNILLMSTYLIIALYAIKQSRHFALWVTDKADLHANINFSLDKTDLLFVLFIGLGVYGLIKNLPVLLVNGFNIIKEGTHSNYETDYSNAGKGNIAIQIITVLLFFTLVYYARVFADFFASKINNIEPEDEIDNTQL